MLAATAMLAASCSAAVPERAALGATTAPPTSTTTIAATTTTEVITSTTPTAAPARIAVTGLLPLDTLTALAEFYSWLADRRNPEPEVPPEIVAAFRDAEHPVAATLAATGVARQLESGERVAVVYVGEDVLFMVEDAEPWRIVGAILAGQVPMLGGPRLLLVLGSDARRGENQQLLRADSIHIVGVDPSRSEGSIVGFPRDAWVQGPDGGSKFTNVMAGRGPQAMLETAQDLTGLEIEGYVVTGFVGFEGLIRDLGGLIIDLPRSIKSGIDGWQNYPSGLQELGPTAALRLARIRKTLSGGDFARSANHGLIMLAAMAMIQEMGIDALPGLIEILLDHAWTDLPTEDLLTLAAAVYILTPEEMVNMVLPGSVGRVGAQSVVHLAASAQDVYADLADGVVERP